MNTAIYYHPEAYTTSGPRLMGRNAAGESFLRGFIQYSKCTEFWVQVQKKEHANHFAQTVKSLGRDEPIKMLDLKSLGALKEVGNIYCPGPGIAEHAFHRSLAGQMQAGISPHLSWSLSGITHTTASARSMDALVSLISSPVQVWDSVICTSNAVKTNVEKLLQAQANYLIERLGIQRLILPKLPVIPLGIHTEDFNYSPIQKSEARQFISAHQDDLVVLFMGRLSFHAKAHPLAMYQALERAKKTSGKNVILIECGWFANEHIEKAYKEAAHLACPNIKVIHLDGRKPEDRSAAWASADIFCSLSDNIQETFGIVPIEAMAAGLPVVVSDWDGYKDTVREGLDGFRIPTIMPQSGMGTDLALWHALEIETYDMYCGHTSSLIAVDIDAAANAFHQLFTNSELRKKMSAEGIKRAKEAFDWSAIIPEYESLWSAQYELRASSLSSALSGQKQTAHLAYSWPARMDPFATFESYPTRVLNQTTKLMLAEHSIETASALVHEYTQLTMVKYAERVLPNTQEIQAVLTDAALPTSALELVRNILPERQAFVFRSLTWLIKLGVLKVVE